jgi:D-3-phosphoglycerate dehydrogenase
MGKRILFLDTTHPVLPQMLEDAGFICEHFYSRDRGEALAAIGGFNGLITRSKFTIDKEFIDKAANLQFIGRVGAGMENIDVDYARSRQILCFNAPEGNRDAVAEHTTGMLLALTNNLLIADREVRRGLWKREENRGTEIGGKTIGIIGYGNMGTAFAKRLTGFGVNVIAYDKYKTGFGNDSVEEVTMDELFRRADIVSLHLPLTEETGNLVNDEWLSAFSKKIILINTSRGRIVNTAALVKALKNNTVTGACLDVLEYESSSFENLYNKNLPSGFDFLIKSDKVVLSPHIAGWTHESNRKLAEVIATKIIARFKQ